MAERRPGCDDARLWTVAIVHVPLRSWNQRRVFVAEVLLIGGERVAGCDDPDEDEMELLGDKLCGHARIISTRSAKSKLQFFVSASTHDRHRCRSVIVI